MWSHSCRDALIRTILIDELHCSISVICCDLELHMLHHSFQRLQSLLNPGADSALADSISSGGLDFITVRESICKQQKSPSRPRHHALAHKTRDWNTHFSWDMCSRGKIISVYKMHVNVPIFSFCDSGFTAEMEVTGLLSFWKNMKQLQVYNCPLLSCCAPE